MSIQLGAINTKTNEYEYPRIANKENKYKCPDCGNKVHLRKAHKRRGGGGNIVYVRSHFVHNRSDNPCHYYTKPNETQFHKDAKMLVESVLNKKKAIRTKKTCKCSKIHHVKISGTKIRKAIEQKNNI